jgi:hypothetical protein
VSTISHPNCGDGAPLPEVKAVQPRPIVTFRVVVRETQVALRRNNRPEMPDFGLPKLYSDQIAEFPSECTAALALDFVKLRTELGRHFKKDQLVIEPVVHAGLRNDQELALLCRVRDTMVFLAWVEAFDYLSNTRRSMVGVDERVAR